MCVFQAKTVRVGGELDGSKSVEWRELESFCMHMFFKPCAHFFFSASTTSSCRGDVWSGESAEPAALAGIQPGFLADGALRLRSRAGAVSVTSDTCRRELAEVVRNEKGLFARISSKNKKWIYVLVYVC